MVKLSHGLCRALCWLTKEWDGKILRAYSPYLLQIWMHTINLKHHWLYPAVRRPSAAEVLSSHYRTSDTWRSPVFGSLYSQRHVYASWSRLTCISVKSVRSLAADKKNKGIFILTASLTSVIFQNIFTPSLWCSLSRLNLGPFLKVVKKWNLEPNKTLFFLTLFDGKKS